MSGSGGDGEARLARLAIALRDVLEDDEQYVVGKRDGAVTVEPVDDDDEPGTRSRLYEEAPELYGYALGLSARINTSDRGVFWIVLPFVVLCVLLHLELIDPILGREEPTPLLMKLRSFWVYIVLVVVGFGIALRWSDARERAAYASERAELLEAVRGAGMSVNAFVAHIEGASGLSTLGNHLKRDAEALLPGRRRVP